MLANAGAHPLTNIGKAIQDVISFKKIKHHELPSDLVSPSQTAIYVMCPTDHDI
jgi:hypothetical protein